MKLRWIRRRFHRLSEAGHEVTLTLVGIAAVAALFSSVAPTASELERQILHLIHLVHWVALALAIAYTACMILFGRNVAREIAKDLSLEHPKAGPFIVLLPRDLKYRYQSLEMAETDVEFVDQCSGRSWSELLRLNGQGFDGSAFEIDTVRLRDRNTEWVRKNDRLFMLVRSATDKPRQQHTYIGYTAVVPLTDSGADVYLRGFIKDCDLPASQICAPGEPTQTLLIFAVALDRGWLGLRSLGRPQLNRLLRALEYHLEVVAKAHQGHPNGIAVWTQTEHRSIAGHLQTRGFRSTTPVTKSADGFELVRMELVRPATATQGAGDGR